MPNAHRKCSGQMKSGLDQSAGNDSACHPPKCDSNVTIVVGCCHGLPQSEKAMRSMIKHARFSSSVLQSSMTTDGHLPTFVRDYYLLCKEARLRLRAFNRWVHRAVRTSIVFSAGCEGSVNNMHEGKLAAQVSECVAACYRRHRRCSFILGVAPLCVCL